MNKGIVVASAVAVVAISGAFVANKVVNDKPDNETTTYIQEYSSYDDSNEYDNYTTNASETEPTTEETTTEKTDKYDALSTEELLEEIKKFPYGTAGSSAKAVVIAADFINYAENTDEEDQAVLDIFSSFKRAMSSARYEEYLNNLYTIEEYVEDLYNGKNADFFNSVDYTIQTEDGKFSLENVQKYYTYFGGE